MANEAALVARIEARMDKYEKAMKGAEETADRTVKNIESTFASTTIGTTVGNVLAKALTGAFEAMEKFAREAIEKFQELQRVSEATGLTLQQAFAIEKVLGPGGASAFEKIAEQIDRMQRGEKNYLSKLFDENGFKNIKDAQGAMEAIRQILGDVASIQVREIGKGLGLDDAQVKKLRELPGDFNAATKAAAAGAPDLARIAQAAEDFEDLWKKALTFIKLFLAETFQDMKAPVADFIARTAKGLQVVVEALGLFADLTGDSAGADRFRGLRDSIKGTGKDIEAFAESSRQLGPRLSEMARPARGEEGGPTADPKFRAPSLGSKSGGGGTDRLNALEREERRATERTKQMELEGKLIGQNVETRTRELEVLRLTQMAEREKIPLTEAVRMKIDEQAEAYGRAAGKLDELMRKNQQSVALQTFAGNMLVDTIMQATEAGAKFSDIMAGIAKQLARAALQALILGQGPLAGLLGTAPSAAGQTGGLIGGIVKALPKYAAGGVVPGSGPVPIMAHGGEVVVPKAVVQSIATGNSGGGASVFHIDARGAQAGVAEQIVAALRVYDAQQGRNLPGRMRTADMRFG